MDVVDSYESIGLLKIIIDYKGYLYNLKKIQDCKIKKDKNNYF